MPIPFQHCEAEALQAVRNGELQIRADGSIWRVSCRRGDPHNGGTKLIPCRPRRAEKKTTDGYLEIGLRFGNRRPYVRAHRLVWVYHYGPIEDGKVINHLNGNKRDNRIQNLEVATPSENRHWDYDVLGMKSQKQGVKHHGAKLSEDEVRLARKLRRQGMTLKAIARQLGNKVRWETIQKIVQRTRWKHV